MNESHCTHLAPDGQPPLAPRPPEIEQVRLSAQRAMQHGANDAEGTTTNAPRRGRVPAIKHNRAPNEFRRRVHRAFGDRTRQPKLDTALAAMLILCGGDPETALANWGTTTVKGKTVFVVEVCETRGPKCPVWAWVFLASMLGCIIHRWPDGWCSTPGTVRFTFYPFGNRYLLVQPVPDAIVKLCCGR